MRQRDLRSYAEVNRVLHMLGAPVTVSLRLIAILLGMPYHGLEFQYEYNLYYNLVRVLVSSCTRFIFLQLWRRRGWVLGDVR